MDVLSDFPHLRLPAIALISSGIVFMISAWVAAYFRRWPLPAAPLDQLTAVANDRVGWTAQAILFPVTFLATAAIFAVIAAQLPPPGPRGLAAVATLLWAVGACLWLPISWERLQLGARAAELLRTFDPGAPPAVLVNSRWAFWPHTFGLLMAVTLMGTALAWAGVLPSLGGIIAAAAALGAVIGRLIWRDWPPFMSYLLVLALAIALFRRSS